MCEIMPLWRASTHARLRTHKPKRFARPASIEGMTDLPAISALADKICSRSELLARAALLARPLVFTNGVFDVLHRGHVMYLAQARALGASLVVALNTDASAKRLGKGPDRPLNKELDRAFVIAALASVSLVTWFDEDTPLELVAELRPDLLVKGGDYDMSQLAETRVVQAYGGRALAIPFVDGYSTTALVRKIRRAD
jgi:rfaE bifunctional protein nucleotidyltransferase chain/domain